MTFEKIAVGFHGPLLNEYPSCRWELPDYSPESEEKVIKALRKEFKSRRAALEPEDATPDLFASMEGESK